MTGVVKGFAKATGQVVAYLNAGDIFHQHAFCVVSEVMTHDRQSTGSAAINSRSMKPARSSRWQGLHDTGASSSSMAPI